MKKITKKGKEKMSERYSALTSPIVIRGRTFKSRFYYPTAQVHFLQGPEIYPGDPVVTYYERYAQNGAAFIISQELSSPTQRTQKGHDSKHFCQYDIYDKGAQNYFTQFAHFIHCQGSFLGVEMSNLELRLNYSVNDPNAPAVPMGMPGGPGGPGGGDPAAEEKQRKMRESMMRDGPEGPSPGTGGFPGTPNPRTIYLTEEKMEEFFDIVVERTKLYKSFGYDGVLIDMGGDFLCGEFLSEMKNRRTDEYNGSFENRIKFPVKYIKALRKGLGEDFIIAINAPGIGGGGGPFGKNMSVEEGVQLINALAPYADIFRLSGMMMPGASAAAPEDLAAELKAKGAKMKICVNNTYMDLDKTNDIIASGKADLVAAARLFICNENLGEILANGNGEDMNPCIECGICRGSSPMGDWMSHCTINPRMGMDHRVQRMIKPVEKLKKVAIIGGGPGGMKCAMFLKERGHTPVIFEATDALGGQIKTARYPSFKYKLERYLDFLINQMDRKGIEVRLNTKATPEMIKAEGFDVVIAATGATPAKPNIPGAEIAKWDAINIYGKEDEIGKKVCVIGGSSAPSEAATHLALKGHDVTLLCRKNMIGYDLNPINARGQCNREAIGAGVDIITSVVTTKIEEGKVYYTDAEGVEHVVECDDILAAGGMCPNSEAAVSFYGSAPEFYTIGDCREAGSMRTAIRDAYTTAIRI